MKWQRYEWSCGAACVVNAFRCFNIKIPETKVISVSNTGSPHKCPHCRNVYSQLAERTCTASMWRCKCVACSDLRRTWRDDADCSAGTDEHGIIAAIRHFGDTLTASAYQSNSRDNAWQWLHGSLIHGRVAILCISSWQHWVLAMSTSGDRVTLFDPYPSKKNQS